MALSGVRVEGGLLGPDLIAQVERGEAPGQAPADFDLGANARLLDEISRSWSDAKDYWSVFKRRQELLPQNDPHGTTLTRQQWVGRLLDELLGYDLKLLRAAPVVNDRPYPISHRAGGRDTDPPVHIVGFKVDLDRRDPEAGRRLSPQALVQEYINRSEEQLWGIVTNGLQLRLLRDTARTTKPTFVEFDLVSMLDGDRFNEFAVFYRLCHRSRLTKAGRPADQCWLEQYYQDSIEQGGRVRDKLRDGVEEALTILGTAFLRHPGNGALVERAQKGSLAAPDLYRQLLRLVYRLLFLMVAEERGMIRASGAGADRRQQIYDRHYGVTRLRERAVGIIEPSPYGDLWASLRQTFTVLANGGQPNPLGIPPLNGDLFAPNAVPDILNAELDNDRLLLAVRRLALFRDGDVLRRVNYGALDVEELGSVYESLLERHPAFEAADGNLVFNLVTGGGEKRSTGSYYTRPELVHELVKSALVPVLREHADAAGALESKERAILALTVCDPACGSGHFLLAAARQIGRELAKIRTGEEEPTPVEFHRAVRDVIQHCVYGVDLNPLAVDLCKLALWIESHNVGLPLTFLDHRIKAGNSLVGVFSMDALVAGVPDSAYEPVFGDDKAVARALKRQNKTEREAAGDQLKLLRRPVAAEARLAFEHADLDRLPENTVADIHAKERRYRDLRLEGSSWWKEWTAANLWTSAFFLPLTKATTDSVPTTKDLRTFMKGGEEPANAEVADRLGEALRFFHWPLEFPEVFAHGGFDVVLGNPPWEQLELDEEEFFGPRARAIAEAPTKARRQTLIAQLPDTNPGLFSEYLNAKHGAEALNRFVRHSDRYQLTAVGRFNSYALFSELGRALAPRGAVGLVVPTGIATDDTYKDFFASLIAQRQLASVYDFENRKGLFVGVDSRYKFCLLTITSRPVELASFAFFLQRAEDLADVHRRFSMPPGDLALFNPNSRTCPVFRTSADMDLTRKIYRRVPILINEATGANTWGISFRQGLFNLSSDSQRFRQGAGEGLVPLYEGKMVGPYDHRAASVRYVAALRTRQSQPVATRLEQHEDPSYRPNPLWWVPMSDVEARIGNWSRRWLICFKDITSATNERTMIAALLPRVGVGHTCPLIFSTRVGTNPAAGCFLLANLNSLVFDYLARQKVGGLHLTFFIVKQCPVLEPTIVDDADLRYVTERVLRLTYVSNDMRPFARDCGCDGPPFPWDETERARVLAELDGYFAHLYGLTRDELRYMLDPEDIYGSDFPGETFRVLKEREKRELGEYRTGILVLKAYDELARNPRFHRVGAKAPADDLS